MPEPLDVAKLKQELVEELKSALVAEIRRLSEELRRSAPETVSRKDACLRLGFGMTKLKAMISRGDIATCMGDPTRIPMSEIRRFTQPALPAAKRRSGGRPKAQKFDAKAEAAAGRAALKKT